MVTRNKQDQLPDLYRKAFILSSIFGVFGVAIGAYFTSQGRSYIYIIIGALVGGVIGDLVALACRNKLSLQPLLRIRRVLMIGGGVLTLTLAVACIAQFIFTFDWIGLVGAVFFGLSAVYLFSRGTQREDI